ncbi:ABC transporter permease [Erysipelothrix sp. HDW6C]|uniref:ABC transporter permease n=1 Tax=Erysipelothrix sp. HDW6C TaxID=2714930 RepID=UPI00140E81C2|nr:ABC transporter permease [Erysipelothrix sp. HDW6C]QIK70486.1 ABC transporter permease [Erysipelothrix sp. HDW6C]
MRKAFVMMKLKTKMLMTNTSALTGPLMAVGITILMRVLYGTMATDPEMLDYMFGMALSMGVSMNIGMGAVMMTALPLAEEKEKNTLRTLMTSSVNAKHFFIGSLLPPFLVTVAVNFLLVFVSGINIANINFIMFTALTVVASLISCVVGLVVGIYSKSQVNANNIMMPITLILAMLPTFSVFNESMATASRFIYTGMLSDMLKAFNLGEAYSLELVQIGVLIACTVISIGLFIYFYKKNGMESD